MNTPPSLPDSTTTVDSWLRSPEAGGAEPPPPSLADGAAFGPFRILGALGRGATAEVYRARQEPSGVCGALKVARPAADKNAARRFARETRFLAQHPHPALPRYLGSGETDGRAWLFVEELEPGPLPRGDRRVARFLLALARGVAHVHAQGCVHRDIKPKNILFRRGGAPVLIDLGLVKRSKIRTAGTADPPDTTTTTVGGRAAGSGTPGWSAPEQFDRGEATPASDVHALGILADACFGGKPPRAWRTIVRRATSSLPAERYPDAASFVRAIRLRHAGRWVAAAAVFAVAAACAVLAARHAAPAARSARTPLSAAAAARFKAREAARQERWAPFWSGFRAWCADHGSPLASCEPGTGAMGHTMLLARGRGFHVQFSVSDAGLVQLELYASAEDAEAADTTPQAVMDGLRAHRGRIESRFADPASLGADWNAGKAGARSRVARFARGGTADPERPSGELFARTAADGEALLAALRDLGLLEGSAP